MGSTYLELTNRVLRRLNEVELTSSNFASARGLHAAAKDAVLDAVRKINLQKFQWPFNATTGTQTLTIGQTEYTWPAALRFADWESFIITNDGVVSNSTTKLRPIGKDEWYKYLRPDDLDHTSAGLNKPIFVFEAYNGGFGISPAPNAAYVIGFRYWIKTITLSAHGDVCTVPTEYDDVITDGALMNMFMFLDNDERARKAESDFDKGLKYMAYILIPEDPYAYASYKVTPWDSVSDIGMFTYR